MRYEHEDDRVTEQTPDPNAIGSAHLCVASGVECAREVVRVNMQQQCRLRERKNRPPSLVTDKATNSNTKRYGQNHPKVACRESRRNDA
jgi:hypothetical protein